MKTVRQQRILELIQMHDIEKQEELVKMLCEEFLEKMENLSIRQQNQSTNRPNQNIFVF